VGIATILEQYLTDHAVAVVIKGGDGFMLAVLPASRHIRFEELRRLLADDVGMANEEQIETLFLDCEPGAVPAVGAAYGLGVIIDDSLARQPDIYFESGDPIADHHYVNLADPQRVARRNQLVVFCCGGFCAG
jgi:prolyl-tRNA editing enzyme YbaK/EbsC (Cys-tRNA(Pro) deacylase)